MTGVDGAEDVTGVEGAESGTGVEGAEVVITGVAVPEVEKNERSTSALKRSVELQLTGYFPYISCFFL